MLKQFNDTDLSVYHDYSRDLSFSKTCYISHLYQVEDVVFEESYSEKLIEGVVDCVSSMEDEYWEREAHINSQLNSI